MDADNTQNKTELLRGIKDEVVAFSASPLYRERVANGVLPVIGEGSHDAHVMFIGEAPGKNEAATGKPFCGAAGRVLDELLAHIALPRKEAYITNIVKDRPPQNRDPLPEEIAAYAPFLDRQIAIIRPKVIATLGRFSMAYIMERLGLGAQLATIGQLHGKVLSATMPWGEIRIVPLYHPAAAIYDQRKKDTLKKDMEVVKKLL
jgi:DNA polymerase